MGAEYLITKERLALASAPYVPHESFLHQRQKHIISNFIRGLFRGSPAMIQQGYILLMPLNTTLCISQVVVTYLYEL